MLTAKRIDRFRIAADEPLLDRRRIIFVGSFVPKPGVYGGQVAACTSLMRSDFAEAFDIIQIDSTQQAVPPPPVWRRILPALSRLASFAYQTIRQRPHAALIFFADGLSFLEKSVMALFAKQFGVRVVIAPRSGFLTEQHERYPLLRSMVRRVFRSADIIICQSRYWANTFARMGAEPPEKCVVLKNWLNTPGIEAVPDLDASSRPLHLGFLAWVDRSKGIFDLLEAVAMLRQRGRSVLLEVAGDGRDLLAAKERAQDLGISDIVRFLGWVSSEDKLRFLSNAHVVILPSYAEGMPNAMLEAMAAGRPVIAGAVGGIPDVLADSGAGILHKPGDVAALAAAIEFYDDHRAQLAQAGACARAIIARDHSITNASRVLQECLRGA